MADGTNHFHFSESTHHGWGDGTALGAEAQVCHSSNASLGGLTGQRPSLPLICSVCGRCYYHPGCIIGCLELAFWIVWGSINGKVRVST